MLYIFAYNGPVYTMDMAMILRRIHHRYIIHIRELIHKREEVDLNLKCIRLSFDDEQEEVADFCVYYVSV